MCTNFHQAFWVILCSTEVSLQSHPVERMPPERGLQTFHDQLSVRTSCFSHTKETWSHPTFAKWCCNLGFVFFPREVIPPNCKLRSLAMKSRSPVPLFMFCGLQILALGANIGHYSNVWGKALEKVREYKTKNWHCWFLLKGDQDKWWVRQSKNPFSSKHILGSLCMLVAMLKWDLVPGDMGMVTNDTYYVSATVVYVVSALFLK